MSGKQRERSFAIKMLNKINTKHLGTPGKIKSFDEALMKVGKIKRQKRGVK